MEMLWYLKHGETPKTDLILSRMSEAGICLLTGETDNVLAIPVNLNTNNMLPSNMVCLSRQIIENISYTYNYTINCSEELAVTFNSPECFVDYNRALLAGLNDELQNLSPKPPFNNFLEIYELLMSRHVKGIEEINVNYMKASIDWSQLQRYWFTTLEKKSKQKLKIITSL